MKKYKQLARSTFTGHLVGLLCHTVNIYTENAWFKALADGGHRETWNVVDTYIRSVKTLDKVEIVTEL